MRCFAKLAVLVAALIVAGCGGVSPHPSHVSHPATTPSVRAVQAGACTPQGGGHFARLGLCVPGLHQPRAALPLLSGLYPNGIDVSLYQGLPDWRRVRSAGVRFVWNQSSDGFGADWNFTQNTRVECADGLIPGAYIFLRPGDGYAEGQYLARRIQAAGRCGSELPPLLDTEVAGAYEQAANAAAGVRSILGNIRVAVYTSPGLWSGCCRDSTLLDAAIWWQPGYSFAGWPGYIAQQYCGVNCHVPGISEEVDLQTDHGVLALVHPTPPCDTACRNHALAVRLHALERRVKTIRHEINLARARIRTLRYVLALHLCHTRHGPHAYRACPRWAREGRAEHHWGDALHAEGRRVVAAILAIQAKGIR